MRYLVTGGAGFIGSHLADALVERGDEVVALDDVSTGALVNIAHLVGRPDFTFVEGTTLDPDLVEKLAVDTDAIVHLAAAVGVRLIVEHPLESIITNIRGTEHVLAAAAALHRRVLIASTSEVYGKNSYEPLKEDADRILGSPFIARWSYSTTKTVDEILAHAYWRERGTPAIVARLFNCVGPRQTGEYGMVLPSFVRQALLDEPITVHGTGLAAPVLLPHRRHGRRPAGADGPSRQPRRPVQRRRAQRGGDHRPGGDGARPDRVELGDRADPLRGGVRARASRTWSGGCPTSGRSGRSPAGSRPAASRTSSTT